MECRYMEPVFPLILFQGCRAEWVTTFLVHLPAAFSQNLIICFLCGPSCTDGEDEVTPCTPETNRKCVSKNTRASQHNLGLMIGLPTMLVLLIVALLAWKTGAWRWVLPFMKRAYPGEHWLRGVPWTLNLTLPGLALLLQDCPPCLPNSCVFEA